MYQPLRQLVQNPVQKLKVEGKLADHRVRGDPRQRAIFDPEISARNKIRWLKSAFC